MIDQESANVRRAAFVVRGVMDYTISVPAGRAITSGELRRMVKAGTDASRGTARLLTVTSDYCEIRGNCRRPAGSELGSLLAVLILLGGRPR